MQIKSERKVSLFEQCAKSKVRADGQDELLKSHTEAQRFFKKKYSPLCYEDFSHRAVASIAQSGGECAA